MVDRGTSPITLNATITGLGVISVSVQIVPLAREGKPAFVRHPVAIRVCNLPRT